MLIMQPLLVISFFIILCNGSREIRFIDGNSGYVQGYVTHGANNFNGQIITDLSAYSMIFVDAIYEQQVLNEFGENAILPIETTDRAKLLSTGKWFTEYFQDLGISVTPPNDIFNIPYLDIGTNTVFAENIDSRSQLISFDDISQIPSESFPNTYFPDGMIRNPTLADWEKASGLAQFKCDHYGQSYVKITVCGMLPSSLYTVSEVGNVNPGTLEEGVYWHPAGGVGNVIRTNLNGFGEIEFKMPWCPIRECIPNQSIDCTLYLSVFHHSDYIAYGGDFGASTWKPYSYTAGIIGSNHLVFPLVGDLLQKPLNEFRKNCRESRHDYLEY